MYNLGGRGIKISQGLAYASGSADRNGAALDMAGFEGVLVIVQLGAVAAGAVTTVKMQQGQASNLSDAADLAGTAVAIADTDDNGIKFIDLKRPLERYVRVVVDKDGTNACAESVTYLQYGAHVEPVTHDTVVAGEYHESNAEGTA